MTVPLPATLDDQLCFALHSTSLAMVQLYKTYLTPLGLTYPQYIIMLILWEKDNLSLKSIGERLGQQSGSLTPVIKRMEVEGLIQRRRGIEDDRMLSISLTDLGHELKTSTGNIGPCVAQAAGITEQEAQTLQSLLLKLKENLLK